MDQLDPAINKAIESLATSITDATQLHGDAHFNAALQIERSLKQFAVQLLSAAAKSPQTTTHPKA